MQGISTQMLAFHFHIFTECGKINKTYSDLQIRPFSMVYLMRLSADQIIQVPPQQDVHGLSTCSLDIFESKSSNEHESDVQRFVKGMRMSILLHL
jgi:hypothetical protein